MTAASPSASQAALEAADLLPVLYRSEPRYGWSRGMRAVTRSLLAGLVLPQGPVLEVGCGGGQMLVELRRQMAGRTLYGADLHPLGLAHAQARLPVQTGLLRAPLQRLPFPSGTFALVLGLDVFDQEGVDLASALAESRRVLRPGGSLVLRVSAHAWLYGAHDRAFHTGRRYGKRELIRAVAAQGLVMRRTTYANFMLGAPVAVLRLLQRWQWLDWRPGVYHNRAANALVAQALQVEAHWLRRHNFPVGLSLWVVAEKGEREFTAKAQRTQSSEETESLT